MKTSRLLTVLLLFVLALSSCVPGSQHPLSDAKKAKHDKRLIGVWVARTPGQDDLAWLHFTEAKDSMTDIVVVYHGTEGVDVSFYKMYPTTIEKYTYMNLKMSLPDDYMGPEIAKEIESQDYLFARYDISKEGILKVWVMSGGVAQAIREGKIKGKIERPKGSIISNVMITDTSENVAKFLKDADQEDLFELFLICLKVELDLTKIDPSSIKAETSQPGAPSDADKRRR